MMCLLILVVATASAPKNPHLAESVWPTTHQNSWQTDMAAEPAVILNEDNITWWLFRDNGTNVNYTSHSTLVNVMEFAAVGWFFPEKYPYRFTITNLFSSDNNSIYVRSYGGLFKVGINPDGSYRELGRYIEGKKVPKAFYCFLAMEGGEEYFYAAADNYIMKMNSTFTQFTGYQKINVTNDSCGSASWEDVPNCNVIHSINMGYNGVFFVAMTKGLMFAISKNMTILGEINLLENSALNANINISESFSIMNDTVTGDQNIFIPVSNWLLKVVWNGSIFTVADTAPLGDIHTLIGRLGTGIGTTPSVMGSGEGPFYIVVTDGELPMNIWFVNADDFTDLHHKKVLMGHDANYTNVTSEQSVVVSGNRAAVVNNYFNLWKPGPAWYEICKWPWIKDVCRVSLGVASYGVEQFEIDYTTGNITSKWVNNNVSCASSIPVVSAPDKNGHQVFYCIGADNVRNEGLGYTTLEAINWTTGDSLFSFKIGKNAYLGPSWADTEIGPNGDIFYGSLGGLVHIFIKGSVHDNAGGDLDGDTSHGVTNEEVYMIIMGIFNIIFFLCCSFWCGFAWRTHRKLSKRKTVMANLAPDRL